MILTVSSLGERALIDRITARLATPPWVVVGPGDDAAVIEPERGALDVLTTDALVEGIHFDRAFVPDAGIGHRALAVNLSDLAAMGARPRAALLSLVLPETLAVAALDGIVDGLLALAGRHGVSVIGGNITRSPGGLMIDVTATGAVGRRRILRRSGARPGDEVYVTGTIGDAAAGLQMLRAGHKAAGGCVERYLRPEPRVRAGWLLGANRAATSCVDLSDGLADGAWQLARASAVGVAIDAAAVPVSDAARDWFGRTQDDAVRAAVSGGDDYELLFTVRPSLRGRLRGVRRLLGDLPITKIGVVTKDPAVTLGGAPMPGGYEHFGKTSG
ncbi:MAG: thiamine-phosphate kinase [Vicinamibacterales bacterium]